jgi:hypothetical protein
MDKLAQWELQPAVEAIGHSDAKDSQPCASTRHQKALYQGFRSASQGGYETLTGNGGATEGESSNRPAVLQAEIVA